MMANDVGKWAKGPYGWAEGPQGWAEGPPNPSVLEVILEGR